jgi:hypothetical protein
LAKPCTTREISLTLRLSTKKRSRILTNVLPKKGSSLSRRAKSLAQVLQSNLPLNGPQSETQRQANSCPAAVYGISPSWSPSQDVKGECGLSSPSSYSFFRVSSDTGIAKTVGMEQRCHRAFLRWPILSAANYSRVQQALIRRITLMFRQERCVEMSLRRRNSNGAWWSWIISSLIFALDVFLNSFPFLPIPLLTA